MPKTPKKRKKRSGRKILGTGMAGKTADKLKEREKKRRKMLGM